MGRKGVGVESNTIKKLSVFTKVNIFCSKIENICKYVSVFQYLFAS